ncbi:DUF3795 domain-containing protein [Fundidesulfovibrio terrae]|uniref:DUF3795 domain-containing protein n=1 Tax=Fundidesulfovibrio terrae TaxID=2922866 RepID=UPI001FAF25B6|nr:DUF3795 domain-containing protein [Fundidesulfovibrio terrae]
MEYREILERLAPCGLDCGRCADLKGGEIGVLSARLTEHLGEYGRLAAMRAGVRPEFAGYEQFQAVLGVLAGPSCGGCRSDNVSCPLNCLARTCSKENGVHFCFQCSKYPCEEQFAGMPLRKRWQALNDRMKDIGVEAFYEEQLGTPRYPGKIE